MLDFVFIKCYTFARTKSMKGGPTMTAAYLQLDVLDCAVAGEGMAVLGCDR